MDPKLVQALIDYTATANSGKYTTQEEILKKFPEFSGFDDKQKLALKDYVATANSGKYKTAQELNSKFPEFFSVKKKRPYWRKPKSFWGKFWCTVRGRCWCCGRSIFDYDR